MPRGLVELAGALRRVSRFQLGRDAIAARGADGDHRRQLARHAPEQFVPVAGRALAEQPQRRVPRRILALLEPAPIRHVLQCDPNRPPQRPGEMRDGGIDGHHQIEIGHDRGRLRKIAQRGRQINNLRERREIRGAADLQAEPAGPRDIEQWMQPAEPDRAAAVVSVLRVAPPADADLEPVCAEALAPACHQRRLGGEIWQFGWDRIERRAEDARQTHQRALEIVVFAVGLAIGDLDLRTERAHEAMQLGAHEECDARATRRQQRQIARELDDVAQALLIENDDALAAQVFAPPRRKAHRQPAARRVFALPAVFVVRPAGGKIAQRQLHQRSIVTRVGKIGLCRQRAVKTRHRLGRPLELLQRDPAVVQRDGKIRAERQRAVKTRQRFLETVETLQRVAAIVQRIGIIWPQRKRLVKARHRLFGPL